MDPITNAPSTVLKMPTAKKKLCLVTTYLKTNLQKKKIYWVGFKEGWMNKLSFDIL